MLSGTVTFSVAGCEDYRDLGPGAAVFVPRGARRSFRTGAAGAQLLATQTPGWRIHGLAAPTTDALTLRQVADALALCGIELVPADQRAPLRALRPASPVSRELVLVGRRIPADAAARVVASVG
ncbi:hypothetical protein ACI8AF_17350 [Blastococcus sp. SYSU D00669]